MSSIASLIDRYCLGWNAPSATEREAHIRAALTPDATYTDPRADNLSVTQLLDHITKVMSSRPGARVVRTSGIDTHHHCGRFAWHVLLPDGSHLPGGIDFVEFSTDGSAIRRIVGFFGPLALKEEN